MNAQPLWRCPATKAAAVIIVGLGVGTGGSANEDYIKLRGDLGYEIFPGAARAAEKPQSKVASDLELIRSALKISVSSVGSLFGVSRQSVYLWMRGEAPGTDRADRITKMASAIAPHVEFFRSQAIRAGQHRVEDGRLVVEALAASSDPGDIVTELVAKLSGQKTRRHQFAERLRQRPRMNRGAADNETSV